ncbi:MAG: ROK family protein [Armatimonadota bacterium]|nr:ROK family protein [Armatimonadota bacterium]
MRPNVNGSYIVGVDLGGTNVRAAVTDKEGRFLGEGRRPSLAMEGFEITLAQIIQAIRDAIASANVKADEICGIGMGVPGRHISREGIVLWSPNFKDWGGVQLLAPIREAIGVPAYMGNDVNVAALGEFRFGAGKEVNSLVMLTLGTGIGGGIILDGKLWLGANEGGGEIGHQIVNPNGFRCGCGRFGDLEAEAAQAGIIERAQRMIRAGNNSILLERGGPNLDDITPAMIAEAANEGDEVAREVMRQTGYWVGIGVANAINFLNPEMVVIGGGISQAGPVLWEPLMATVRANALAEALSVCQVVPAALGDDAGILGGVVLVLQELEACA